MDREHGVQHGWISLWKVLGLLDRFGDQKPTYPGKRRHQTEPWSPSLLSYQTPPFLTLDLLVTLFPGHWRTCKLAHISLCPNSCSCLPIALGQISYHVLIFLDRKTKILLRALLSLRHTSLGTERRGRRALHSLEWWGLKEPYRAAKEHFLEQAYF